MSQSENKSKEVDDIRKILFGDQVAQFQDQFTNMEKSISQLRTENRNLRQALEAEMTQREQAIEAEIAQREQAIEDIRLLVEKLESDIKSQFNARDETLSSDTANQVEMLHTLQQTLEKRVASLTKTGK